MDIGPNILFIDEVVLLLHLFHDVHHSCLDISWHWDIAHSCFAALYLLTSNHLICWLFLEIRTLKILFFNNVLTVSTPFVLIQWATKIYRKWFVTSSNFSILFIWVPTIAFSFEKALAVPKTLAYAKCLYKSALING